MCSHEVATGAMEARLGQGGSWTKRRMTMPVRNIGDVVVFEGEQEEGRGMVAVAAGKGF